MLEMQGVIERSGMSVWRTNSRFTVDHLSFEYPQPAGFPG